MTDISDSSGSPASFRIAASALIFDGERVLLAHRRDIDWWNLPGGGMEVGETVEEALYREVYEETGLQVEIEQLVGVYSKLQKHRQRVEDALINQQSAILRVQGSSTAEDQQLLND